MDTFIAKNKEFIILSDEITNAAKCIVIDSSDEDIFRVKLCSDEKYNQDEQVDLFTVAGSGVLYFQTRLKSVEGTELVLQKPEKQVLIQRREYTRAEINKNILIYTEEKTIRATITDISAGGMCLVSDTEMSLKKDYQTDFSLEKTLFVSCKFRPVRVNLEQENKYVISGRFSLIKNIDRVALAQYCMKKQAELQNK